MNELIFLCSINISVLYWYFCALCALAYGKYLPKDVTIHYLLYSANSGVNTR